MIHRIAEQPVQIADYTIIPLVEKRVFNTGGNNGCATCVSRRVHGIVLVSGAYRRAWTVDGNEVPLKRMTSRFDGLDRILHTLDDTSVP